MQIKYKKTKGFSLVEIIIASSILLISVVSIFSAFTLAVSTSAKNTAMVQATFLLEEGNEALRNMRDFSFSTYIASLDVDRSYRLEWVNSHWQATTTNTFIDNKFDRSFTVNNVMRDASNNVVNSGGTIDPNIKNVLVVVSWKNGSATTSKTMQSYVSNIFSN